MMKKLNVFFLTFLVILILGGCEFKMSAYEYSDQLYHAIVDNDEEEFERLLAEKGDLNQPRSSVNFTDYKNVYPLEIACESSVKMANRLLEEGADPAIVDDYLHSTPLIFCLAGREPERFELAMKLIESGADASDVDDNRRTALIEAAFTRENDNDMTREKATELMQYIFDYCDVEKIMEKAKESPLNAAVNYGNVTMVKYILDNKLLDIDRPGNGGRTPLMDSARKGNADMVKLLLSYGASKEGRSMDGKTCVDYAKEGNNEEVIRILTEE